MSEQLTREESTIRDRYECCAFPWRRGMKRPVAIAHVVGSPRVGPRRLAARLCVLAMFLAGSARGASPVTAMPLRAVETGVLVSQPNGQRLEEIVTFTSTISAA